MLIKIEITRQDFDFLNFRLFGWLVNTEAPSTSELLGATLEIQRTQTAELMEQRMIRQQQVGIVFFHSLSLFMLFAFWYSTVVQTESGLHFYFFGTRIQNKQ